MRLTVGTWTLEKQLGRPYFVRGYRLEPVAWVLRATKGRVVVPMQGEPTGHAWVRARVFPVGVSVTAPDGRRHGLLATPEPPILVLLLAVISAALVAAAWRRRTLNEREELRQW